MSWLIEVKTGRSRLEADQLDAYLDLAREGGFDALLTISNEITSSPTESPVQLPARGGRRPQRPPHYHLSWWRVLAEAAVQHQHRGVSDPDQAWILDELIKYLDDERSGVIPFRDMGPAWTHVRDAARQQRLNVNDEGVRQVVERWEQLVEYLCLSLFRDLGRPVEVTSNRETPEVRRQQAVVRLADEGKLTATVKVADAAAPIRLETDLRARMVYASVELAAPQDRARPSSRVNWLLRQLRRVEKANGLHVEALYPRNQRSGASLEKARDSSEVLLDATDASRLPRAFRITYACEMAGQRGRRQEDGGFIESHRQHVGDFYRDVVQDLVPWRPPAPRLVPTPAPEEEQLVPPAGEVVEEALEQAKREEAES